MREKDMEALKGVRAQVKLVERLRQQTKAQGIGPCSPRMDGMPRGSAGTAGLDARMIRMEEMNRILKREEAVLRQMERRARKAMAGMKEELYSFCAVYYIAGQDIFETMAAIDRSERQCWRYKREIEGEDALEDGG